MTDKNNAAQIADPILAAKLDMLRQRIPATDNVARYFFDEVYAHVSKQRTPDLTGARIAEQHIDRIRELEAEVANLRAAFNEWLDKTDFIQKRIASGELPVKYLGWHRADVMRDLIEQAQAGAPLASMARAIFGDQIGGQMDAMAGDTADGDTDGARYEALEREHLGDADKGTGIYHPDNQRAGDGLAAKRARIEADMARGSRLTSHRLRLDEQHPGERPPADLATMLLWLKRRMTWGMVHIPGAEVARLVAEIEALQRGQHDIEARARQLVADAAASGQVVRIDLVPRQPLAMGNLEMVVDVRPARVPS